MNVLIALQTINTVLPIVSRILPKIIKSLEDGNISNAEVVEILLAALDQGATEAESKNTCQKS